MIRPSHPFLRPMLYLSGTAARPMLLSVLVFAVLQSSARGQNQPAPENSQNWPSFRGNSADGVSDGQNLPDTWDVTAGRNIKWRTRIPGLAHSSPVIWGDRLFVTTAISSEGVEYFKHGLFGAGDASPDSSSQRWVVLCYDKKTGALLWQRVAFEGRPRDKRHIKATYANSTPATDGRRVVAFFGSQGIHAYDLEGNKLWERDLGKLNMGAYDAPSYEWGPASSPIIHENAVMVQCDTQHESFIIALEVTTGETLWRTTRDELPSWGTPTLYRGRDRTELVTNSSNYIYGYDPASGKELWRLGGSSKITAPTPVFKDGLIVVASGRRPEKPIFVIRAGASGDISLTPGQDSNDHVVWHKTRRGPYMPTPLIYGDYLYTLQNGGILDCYELRTGREIYRQRISHQGGGFSASPVASDGRLFLAAEDGDLFVVKAGPQYELVAQNDMGELLMATPAISQHTLYVRAKEHLFAIGE